MTQHRGRMVIGFAGILAAIAIGGCQDSAAPGPPVTGVQMARGGGGNQVVVEFKRPPSAELESFFADVATLDFASAPQPLPGKIGKYSIQTQPAPFTLSLESMAGFADGKDPQNDPACETEWFEIILDAAAANGGSLDGSLEIGASWDQQLNVGIGVIFSVTVGEWEYAIRVPMSWGPQRDRLVQVNAERIVLAVRQGYPRFWRREAGTKGGSWQEVQYCSMNSDRSNGFMDFELWVSTQ